MDVHRNRSIFTFMLTAMVLGFVFWTHDTTAQPLGTFGFGGRSAGMAGAGVELINDFDAVYLSPSTMVYGKSSVGVGFMWGVNAMRFRLSPRPSGYDVPGPQPEQARTQSGSFKYPAGLMVGGSTGFGLDWLRLGVLAYIPLGGFGKEYTYYADERERFFSNTLHYQLLEDQLSGMWIIVGMAFKVLPYLSLGGGMAFIPSTSADSLLYMPNAADDSTREINLRSKTKLATAAIASITVSLLHQRLRLGGYFRDQLCMRIQGATSGWMAGTNKLYPINQPVDFVTSYSPRQVGVSAAMRLKRVRASLDISWQQWSRYLDNHDKRAGFHDTVNASLGAEVPLGKAWVVRTGVGYRQSPVPEQTGRTNFVDNDMLAIAVGGQYSFNWLKQTLQIQIFFQFQGALRRSNTKKVPKQGAPACGPGVTDLCDESPSTPGLQTGNPGFPGYSSGGWLIVSGIEVIARF